MNTTIQKHLLTPSFFNELYTRLSYKIQIIQTALNSVISVSSNFFPGIIWCLVQLYTEQFEIWLQNYSLSNQLISHAVFFYFRPTVWDNIKWKKIEHVLTVYCSSKIRCYSMCQVICIYNTHLQILRYTHIHTCIVCNQVIDDSFLFLVSS